MTSWSRRTREPHAVHPHAASFPPRVPARVVSRLVMAERLRPAPRRRPLPHQPARCEGASSLVSVVSDHLRRVEVRGGRSRPGASSAPPRSRSSGDDASDPLLRHATSACPRIRKDACGPDPGPSHRHRGQRVMERGRGSCEIHQRRGLRLLEEPGQVVPVPHPADVVEIGIGFEAETRTEPTLPR